MEDKVENPQLEEPSDSSTQPNEQETVRSQNIYRNQLMLPKWFDEIPSDLECDWLVKMFPLGIRHLLVAQNGCTTAYSNQGKIQATFQSELPGGNQYSKDTRYYTLLDCIYDKKVAGYYIIDVIAWRKTDLHDSPAEFRFFWLKSKLDENPELKTVTRFNEYPFYEIEAFPAELPLIEDKLSQPSKINDEFVGLNGIAFFHRNALYVSSRTPFVKWLKPFMVPEKLNMYVDGCYMRKLPVDYVSMEHYMINMGEPFSPKPLS